MWSNLVGEVVCIFRDFKSERELKGKMNLADARGVDISDEIQLEVRWLYRRSEIAGVSGSGLSSSLDEVFETDELDVVQSTSLLGPVTLYDDPNAPVPMVDSRPDLAIPIVNLYCTKFWSLTRKSLIPCGKRDGMRKRGQLYSKFLSKENLGNLTENMASRESWAAITYQATWRDAFVRVIKKLTLKQASTEAYDHGKGLIGREKELDKILSFLRHAIRGDTQMDGVKSSIFIAGPPGLGKTGTFIARTSLQIEYDNTPNFRPCCLQRVFVLLLHGFARRGSRVRFHPSH